MKNPIILFYKDWAYYPSAIPDINTRNKSALKFASILKTMGIKNHHFHLALINPALSGVDPFDPDLTNETKLLIVNECKINPWYFFRECLRIPIEGGIGSKFLEFNRANISLFWCFFNHIRYFLIQPRQTGKSVSADSTYVYLLLLGGLNTKISLLTKDDDLRRRNILRMKKIMDGFLGLLPKTHGNTWLYLYMRSFLRNGDLFSMTLRLLALSILAIIFIPQPLVVIALVALLNYLVIFQLLGLYSAFDYQPLTLLFPMKKGSKKAGLNKTIQLVMGMITVIEGGIGLVFISDKVLLLGLLAYTVALILLYLPFKMARLVDESR